MSSSNAQPEHGRPRLPGRVNLRANADGAIDALLADIFIHANNCVRTFGDFHLAVSATPQIEPALMRLMYDLPYRDFPWQRTRVWMVDELDVEESDARRRQTRLSETIVALSGLPESQFHPLAVGAQAEYQRVLQEHLGWREKGQDRLDCVLLSIDEAGLLSGVGEIEPADAARTVVPMGFVNSARLIAIYGGDWVGPEQQSRLAALGRQGRLGVSPVGGDLVWYLAKPREEDAGLSIEG
ncbi:MAG: 6-phosphogluconolactonase [Planctomycetes bacterium]|nr:6-phosphogluconolactonase [Planctomycetota bacterium]